MSYEIEVIEQTVELVIPPAVVMEMEVPVGVPGQSVEMRYDSGYIQWRRLGDATWNNLVAVSSSSPTWESIEGKPTEFTPSAHGHPIEQIEGLADALDALGTALGGKLNTADFTWANLSGKPTTFTPSPHTHAMDDVTGLAGALSAKLETSEVVNTPTASKVPRTSALGWLDAFLSSAIARLSDLTWTNIAGKPSTFAPSAHTHTTADVTGLDSALALKADLVDGKVPAAQLPGYVDDVLEYATRPAFPTPGDAGKIYVAQDTNKTYRWGGSDYVEIGGGGVALGETSSTAHRGDRGKTAYDHSQSTGNPHNTAITDIAGLNDAIAARVAATEVSTTPTADLVPRANGSGKIADGWLSNLIARLADLTWSNISGKPTAFPPDTHTHPGLLPAGGTTGQVPKKQSATDYDYTWADDGGGSAYTYFDSTPTVIANNTLTPLLDVPIPANTLGAAGDAIEIKHIVSLLNNTGANRTVTLNIKVAGVTVYQDATGNLATSTNARILILEGHFIRTGASTGDLTLRISISNSANTATTGRTDIGAAPTLITDVVAVEGITVDWATIQALTISYQLSITNALLTATHKLSLLRTGGPAGPTGTPGSHTHVMGDVSGLVAALAGKEGSITAGSTAQYWRGDKSWQSLATAILSQVLTGYATGTNTAITAADTLLTALQNLQAQISASSAGWEVVSRTEPLKIWNYNDLLESWVSAIGNTSGFSYTYSNSGNVSDQSATTGYAGVKRFATAFTAQSITLTTQFNAGLQSGAGVIKKFFAKAYANLPTPNGTDTGFINIGVCGIGNGATPTNVAMFQYELTTSAIIFRAYSRASGAAETTTLTYASTWQRLYIEVNGTTDVKYYVDGLLVATHTTIPNGGLASIDVRKTAGSGAFIMVDVDAIGYELTLPSRP